MRDLKNEKLLISSLLITIFCMVFLFFAVLGHEKVLIPLGMFQIQFYTYEVSQQSAMLFLIVIPLILNIIVVCKLFYDFIVTVPIDEGSKTS